MLLVLNLGFMESPIEILNRKNGFIFDKMIENGLIIKLIDIFEYFGLMTVLFL